MQTTAMNEPLFLAEMIWAVLLIVEYGRALEADETKRAAKLLICAGMVLVGAVFTRYDGWIFDFSGVAFRSGQDAAEEAMGFTCGRGVRSLHGDGGSRAARLDGLLFAAIRRSAGLYARPLFRQGD